MVCGTLCVFFVCHHYRRGKKLLVRAVKSLDNKDKTKAIRICTKGLAVTPLEAIKLQSALY